MRECVLVGISAFCSRKATDGAKRCLLDYTLQRTQSAETELAGLLALVAEIEGGAAAAKTTALEQANDRLREQCAAMHLEALQFLGLFVFGLVAGVLAHRTGRLGPSVAAHVGFNVTTVVTLWLTR